MTAEPNATPGTSVPRGRGRNGGAQRGPIVPAAARALSVFEIFAREKRELTKSEVARLLDVPESSGSDLLDTLHQLGYVARTPTSRRYYPTGRLMTIAREISQDVGLTAFGLEATKLMAERTGETSVCAVLEGDKIKVVAVAEGRHRLRYMLNVGDTFTVHATAIGKALLGGLDEDTTARMLRLRPLARRTDNTLTDPRMIEEEVRRGRERGYYTATDEGTVGVSSLAISDRIGNDVVGVGIIGPTDRIRANLPELEELVLTVGRTVFASR